MSSTDPRSFFPSLYKVTGCGWLKSHVQNPLSIQLIKMVTFKISAFKNGWQVCMSKIILVFPSQFYKLCQLDMAV